MRVTVCGLGYVGAVTAGCLARLGREVIGVDTDPIKVEAIAAGTSPVSEPHLDELLHDAVDHGRLRVAQLSEAVEQADVVMIAVGTPSRPSGALDLTAVERVCDEIGRALPDDGRYRTVVIRSTILPGTIDTTVRPCLERASRRRAGVDFGLATNPEFLREGSGVSDFFDASRTVIGADEEQSAAAVRAVYEGLEAPIHVVSIRTSEMVKYTDNAFHALKIAFANEIATVARHAGVDGRDVMRLLATDTRLNISPAYLRPGFAFGGSCLPKDLRALTDHARNAGLDLPLLAAALPSNDAHFQRGLELIEEAGEEDVALLGLSFKSGTDDLRESPAVALAEELLRRGHRLSIYDEDVRPETLRGANRAFIDRHLPHLGALLSESLEATLGTSKVVVVTKIWPAIAELPSMLGSHQTVIDLVGVPWPGAGIGARYVGVGW
jgi:GDP-mannose 6-dehydrogenase